MEKNNQNKLDQSTKKTSNQTKEKTWRIGSEVLDNKHNLTHNDNDNNENNDRIQIVNEILFFNFIRNISFYVESCSIDFKDITSNHLNLFQIIKKVLNNIPNTHENIKRIMEGRYFNYIEEGNCEHLQYNKNLNISIENEANIDKAQTLINLCNDFYINLNIVLEDKNTNNKVRLVI